MALFRRRSPVPVALSAELLPDEAVLANARLVEDGWLAVTRYGLWQVPVEGAPQQWGWPLISRARWHPPVLEVTTADVVGTLAGADVIADRPALRFELAGESVLTDHVHQRVRSGIVSSEHHDIAGQGCWIVLRRVPGRDGLSVQLRADPGTDLAAVEGEVGELVRRALLDFGPS